jgi:hypothetical protein
MRAWTRYAESKIKQNRETTEGNTDVKTAEIRAIGIERSVVEICELLCDSIDVCHCMY